MRTRSVLRGVIWTLIGLLVLFHIGGGWFFSGEMIEDGFVPDPDPIAAPPGDVGAEEVSYSSPLGEMDAWYIPASGSTWVVHVHGKGTTPAEAEHLFAPLQEAGYPQLAIAYRNDERQPEDPSGYYQYGATEQEDIEAALEYARDQGASEVVFSGFSTGASHILAFSYRNNLDVVEAIILDSPNLDFGDTVSYNAGQREMPILPMNVPPTLTPVSKFFTSLRIGVNWQSINYIDRAERSLRVPVLIHHGTADLSVPVSQSIEYAELNPDLVTLVQVQDAGHVDSYEANPEDYVNRVLAFLSEVT